MEEPAEIWLLAVTEQLCGTPPLDPVEIVQLMIAEPAVHAVFEELGVT
jgi:hypothetical protein